MPSSVLHVAWRHCGIMHSPFGDRSKRKLMSLLIASKLIAGGRGLARALLNRAATVALDWDTRQKSRFEATDSAGRRLAVFLPRGRIVRGGDVLVGEDGSLIRVEALAQPILVVTAPSRLAAASASLTLAKAAYHLGNRHVPLEVGADRLVLEPDHVLVELLARMGLDVASTSGPFEPEPGAYDASALAHAQRQGEPRDHPHGGEAQGHVHARDHAHGHDHDHGHVHDDSCGHSHAHAPALPAPRSNRDGKDS